VSASERLSHHDLCFGCGQANLFGLQLELERRAEGGVAGRFFVKQDQQGPPGYAHGGVIAAALDEAMSLLLHGERPYPLTARLEVDLKAPAPVGSFVEVEADVERVEGRTTELVATATVEGGLVARARGTFVRPES
jgi:acyl-coenzyme A thioesterase PaaI-like protein